MTRFYSIVLLLSISLTTVGQSSNYSRNENNELEAKRVRVFEWVLESWFSPDERGELSRLVESSIRSSNAADLRSLQDVAKLNDLIDVIPPAREAEVRAQYNRRFWRSYENSPTIQRRGSCSLFTTGLIHKDRMTCRR